MDDDPRPARLEPHQWVRSARPEALPTRRDRPGAGRGVRMGWGVFLACWAMAGVLALALGRDANHDLRQYHYHNAWALLEGRWALDLAPAGPHSFLHPGLDLLFYLLTRTPLNGWPRVLAVLQAGYAGVLAFLVLAVANLVCRGDARRATAGTALVAIFGLTGAATLPEVGLTQNDIPVACLVIGALLALLLSAADDDTGHARRPARLRLLAGALGGAAVGLKLTAIVFPPALALAAAVAARPGAASRVRAVALLALGGLAGCTLVYGPWGWFLWDRFGNPFGPFFNEVFRSPWFPPWTPRETRFLPETLGKALIYPLLWAGPWAQPETHSVAEAPIRDPRFALGLGALLVVAGFRVWRRLLWPRGWSGHRTQDRIAWAVLGFVFAGYGAWLSANSYIRYAIPIEALLGIPVWLAARTLLSRPPSGRAKVGMEGIRRRGAALCVGTALATCALVTQYPQWAREPFFWPAEPRGTAAVAATPDPLPQGSLVVIVGGFVSFLAPFLDGPGVRFVGATRWAANGNPYYTDDWTGAAGIGPHRFGTEVLQVLRTHPGPVFVLLEDPDPDSLEDYFGLDPNLVRAFGIRFDRASCGWVPNNLTYLSYLCRWR